MSAPVLAGLRGMAPLPLPALLAFQWQAAEGAAPSVFAKGGLS